MTDTEQKQSHSSSELLRSFWPIIMFLLSVAVSVGIFTTQLTQLKEDVSRNRMELVSAQTTFTEIKVSLARIEGDILWIRKQIEEDKSK
jgi:hypothetical protein